MLTTSLSASLISTSEPPVTSQQRIVLQVSEADWLTLFAVLFWAAFVFLFVYFCSLLSTKEQRPQIDSRIESWKRKTTNAVSIYLELMSKVHKADVAPEEQKDSELLQKFDETASRFLCLYEQVALISEQLTQLQSKKDYKKIDKLLYTWFTINFGELPLERASLADGFNDRGAYRCEDLLKELETTTYKLLSLYSELKSIEP